MNSTAREFFIQVVKPTCGECLASIADLRRSILAAIVLHHMNDYWAVEHGSSTTSVREEMNNQCSAIGLIADVADASKHSVLRNESRQVSNADQVKHHAGMLYGHSVYGMDAYNEAPCISIHFKEGDQAKRIAFNVPMLEALRFWQGLLSDGVDDESDNR